MELEILELFGSRSFWSFWILKNLEFLELLELLDLLELGAIRNLELFGCGRSWILELFDLELLDRLELGAIRNLKLLDPGAVGAFWIDWIC